MKTSFLIAAAFAATTLMTSTAMAEDPMNTGASAGAVTGTVGGAIAGAVVGGPVGAVVGAGIGATTGATTGAVVGVSADEQAYARDYVVKREVPDDRVDGDVVVGESLPSTVKVYRIEGNPKLARYHYAYVNKRYVLVDDGMHVVSVFDN